MCAGDFRRRELGTPNTYINIFQKPGCEQWGVFSTGFSCTCWRGDNESLCGAPDDSKASNALVGRKTSRWLWNPTRIWCGCFVTAYPLWCILTRQIWEQRKTKMQLGNVQRSKVVSTKPKEQRRMEAQGGFVMTPNKGPSGKTDKSGNQRRGSAQMKYK